MIRSYILTACARKYGKFGRPGAPEPAIPETDILVAPGTGTTIIKTADDVYLFALRLVNYVLPDFTRYNDSEYVVKGFNVPASLLAQHLLLAAAYVPLVCLFGYFFLKTREVAR